MRVRKQSDEKECGPLVVQAMHEHFHERKISINQIKLKAKIGSNGMNISSLVKLFNNFGFDATAYNAEVEDLIKNKVKFVVALVSSNGMNHFVVISSSNNKIKIFDSVNGEYTLKQEEFKKIYLGSIILVEKIDYKPEEIDITHPLKYLSRNWNVISWISVSILLSIGFTFIAPIYMKIVIDKILPSRLHRVLVIASLSFAFLAVLRAINSFLRSYLVKKLSLQIEKDLTYTYFDKINKASYNDISKVTNSDNLRRISMISHVSGFIANSFFVIFNEFTLMIVSMSLLIWISPNLFSLSLGAAGLIILSTIFFRLFARTKYDDLVKNQMNLFNSFVDSTNQIMEMKNPIVSKFNRNIFSKRIYKSRKIDFELWSYNSLQNLVETIIMYLVPILIVYFGSSTIFENKMTVGSLIMFITVFNSFIDPIKDLADFILKLPQMNKNIELISFIINLKDEPINENGLTLEDVKTISFKDVKIGYDKTILQIDDFVIDESIHVNGKNGSGKSTLLNSISTLIPIEGELKFNKFEKDYYNLNDLRKKIIMINPLTYIPNTTVFEYITLNNPEAIKVFNNNVQKYGILHLLNEVGLSLETNLINNGKNVSSGQRQLITFLRLFAFKYKIIILDEALENIDRGKINAISKSVNDFQDSIFIEVSHSKRYVSKGKEVEIEKINQNS